MTFVSDYEGKQSYYKIARVKKVTIYTKEVHSLRDL